MDNYNHKFRFDNTFDARPLELSHYILHQVGDLFCEAETFIDAHKQLYFEISLIDSGKGYFYTDDVRSEVVKGDVYYSFVGDNHKIASDDFDTLRYFYIAFEAKPGAAVQSIMNDLQKTYAAPGNRIQHAEHTFQFIRNILAEISDKKAFYLNIIDSCITQLLIYLYRSSHEDIEQFTFYKIDTKKELISNIVRYIDHNITDISSIQELSVRFAFERSYLSKMFRVITGIHLSDYILQKKMEKARFLLLNEGKSVTATAELLRYSSVQNFSRAFKQYYTVSPQQYFKQAQLKKG